VRVGRFQVEIFSDGVFRLDGGAMFGIVPKRSGRRKSQRTTATGSRWT
jgi:hypothetical protein